MAIVKTESITRGYRPTPHILEVIATCDALTDEYQTVLSHDVTDFPLTKIITIKNTSENDLYYRISGSDVETPDTLDWIALVAATAIVGEANDYQYSELPWRWLKVECINKDIGQVATVRVQIRSALPTGG